MENGPGAPLSPVKPVQFAAQQRLHPLVLAAAIAVIALSGVGIAALLYGRSDATIAPNEQQLPVTAAAQTTNAEPPSGPVDSTGAPVQPYASTMPPNEAYPQQRGGAYPPQAGGAYPPQPGGAYPPQPGGAYPQAGAYPPPGSPYSGRPSYPSHRTAVANAANMPAPSYGNPGQAPEAQAGPPCYDCAMVESVKEVKVNGQSTGAGAIGGGVLGGVVGHQFGRGSGNTAMTVLGAVGGALAGNAIEKNVRGTTQYDLVVRLNDGQTRTFTSAHPWPYGPGSRVRIINNEVVALN